MKYIFTLVIIVIAVSAVTAFFLWPEPEVTEEDILVTVNGHNLPRSLLEQKKAETGYHARDDRALLDTIIINELLIQEAQRLNIDKEQGFRRSVQNYYEQSLIKILIDRQFTDSEGKATEDDIDRYISNHGKLYTFSRLAEGQEPEQKTMLFDDLSDPLKLMLSRMKAGEEEVYYHTGSEVLSLRLDKVEEGPPQDPFVGNRASIGRIISNYKRERALTLWIKALRDQATITVPQTTEKP